MMSDPGALNGDNVVCVTIICCIQIHKDGEKVREHIAAEAAPKAIANVNYLFSE